MKPDPSSHDDHPELAAKQSRLALGLFFVYLLAYGGFMGLSAFGYELMSKKVWAGVNLAIVYGLGLIVGAFALAVAYMLLSQWIAKRFQEGRR
jgi:uncharacterized membrane protein (DUF485 family)